MIKVKGGSLCRKTHLAFVNTNPGCSADDITKGVTGRAQDIRAARYALERSGQIQLQKDGRKKTFHPKEQDMDRILEEEDTNDDDPSDGDHSD